MSVRLIRVHFYGSSGELISVILSIIQVGNFLVGGGEKTIISKSANLGKAGWEIEDELGHSIRTSAMVNFVHIGEVLIPGDVFIHDVLKVKFLSSNDRPVIDSVPNGSLCHIDVFLRESLQAVRTKMVLKKGNKVLNLLNSLCFKALLVGNDIATPFVRLGGGVECQKERFIGASGMDTKEEGSNGWFVR